MPRYGYRGYGYYGGYGGYSSHDAYNERVQRAFDQPLRLLQCRYFPDSKKWTFSVSSSTGGGQYQLTVTPKKGMCSCPDFARRQKPCKHLLCVLLRVLKMKTEFKNITEIGRNYDDITSILLNLFDVRDEEPQQHEQEEAKEEAAAPATAAAGAEEEEEMCLICLLDFAPGAEGIKKCTSHCKRWLGHHECLDDWFTKTDECPLCKGPQQQAATAAPKKQVAGAGAGVPNVFFEIVYEQPRGAAAAPAPPAPAVAAAPVRAPAAPVAAKPARAPRGRKPAVADSVAEPEPEPEPAVEEAQQKKRVRKAPTRYC